MIVLYAIAWATFLLSFGFCTAAALLGLTRCRSWRIHRAVWFSVLLIGVLAFLPSPIGKTVEIPVLSSDAESVFVPEIVFEEVEFEPLVSEPLVSEPVVSESVVSEPQLSGSGVESARPLPDGRGSEIDVPERGDVDLRSTAKWGLTIAVFIWLGGMLWLPIRMLFRTIRFQRHLRETEPACEEWFAAWQLLQAERNVRRTVPMLTAEDPAIGPALVWRPSGFALVVPLEGWDRLSETERESVMRHELEHFLRNDIPKSLFARILALPHWFNPLAWQTVHRFEDAAEWACDEAALRGGTENLSDFARALVSLHETAMLRPTMADGALQHNIFGRNISRRVARLLSFGAQQKKESAMKKIFLIVAGLLLLATSLVQVKLVAKNAEAETQNKEPEVQNKEPGVSTPGSPREESPLVVHPEADASGSFADVPVSFAEDLDEELYNQIKHASPAQLEAMTRNWYYSKRAELEKYAAGLQPGQEKEPEHVKKIEELTQTRDKVHRYWILAYTRYYAYQKEMAEYELHEIVREKELLMRIETVLEQLRKADPIPTEEIQKAEDKIAASKKRLEKQRNRVLEQIEFKKKDVLAANKNEVAAVEKALEAGTTTTDQLEYAKKRLADVEQWLQKAAEVIKSLDDIKDLPKPTLVVTKKELPADSAKEREELFESGKSAYEADRFAEAKPLLEKFVEKYPHDEKLQHVLYYLGEIAKENQNLDEAEYYFKQSVAMYPNGAQADAVHAGLAWIKAKQAAPGSGTQSPARETYRRSYENSRAEVEAVVKAWRDGTTTFDQLVDAQTRLIGAEFMLRACDPEAKIEPAKPLPIAEALERYKNRNEALADPAYRELVVRWMNAAEEMLRRQFETVVEKNPLPSTGDFQKDICDFLDRVYELYEILGDRPAMQTVLNNQSKRLHQLRQKAINVEIPYFMKLLETRNEMASILKTNTNRLTRIVPEGTALVSITFDQPLDFWRQRMTLKHKDYLETEIKYLNGAQGGRAVDREKARLGWLEARVEYDFFNADLADLRIAALLREESAKNFRQAAKASFNAGVVDESVVKEAEMEVAAAAFAPNNLPVADIAALEKSVTLTDGKPTVLCLKIVRTSGPPTRREPGVPFPAPNKPVSPQVESHGDKSWEFFGIRYGEMSKELWKVRAGNHFDKYPNGGILVTETKSDGLFHRLGVRKGDMIVGIHKWCVTSENDLSYIMKVWAYNSGPVRLLLLRGNELYFATIPIGTRPQVTATLQVVKDGKTVGELKLLGEQEPGQNLRGLTPPAREATRESVAVDPDYVKLLEKRVELSKQFHDQTEAMFKHGAAGGHAHMFYDAQVRYAGNRAALYKYTGDREKFLAALREKLEAAKSKKDSINASYRVGTATLDQMTDADLALAEAEYELKQAEKQGNNEPGTASPDNPGAQLPARGGKKELTFQGKTFEQWVEELKTELDPKLRAEAFRALTVFGANGKGREAAAAIVAELRNYDYSVYDDSPVGMMKEAAIEAFVTQPPFDPCIPLDDSLPILIRCFKEGNASQQSLATMVVQRFRPENTKGIDLELFYDLLLTLKHKDQNRNAVGPHQRLLQMLGTVDPSGDYVLRFLKESLKNDDAKGFSSVFTNHFSIEESKKANPGQWWSWNSGIHPFVFTNESFGGPGMGGMGYDPNIERKRTPFGEKLLKFLQDEGMKSENATIRETSTKIVEALLAVDKGE